MSIFFALLLGFVGQGAMNSSLAKGELPFIRVLLVFGILGSIPFLGWLMYGFSSFMNMDALYSAHATYDELVDRLILPSTVAGAYWLLVFIGLWRSAGRLSTGRMLISRYFSVTWLSSAAACFFIIAKVPFVIMLVVYFIAKRSRAKKENDLVNC